MVVVPYRRGQGEDALHDAGDDAVGCASAVAFEVELALEGFVDRLDDLPQRLEEICARPLPFAFARWPQQLGALIGEFAFEGAAEVVLVADQSLSGTVVEEVGFGG